MEGMKWRKNEPNQDGWWLTYFVKRKVMMVGLFKKGEDGEMYACNEDYEPQVPLSKLLAGKNILFEGPIPLP